MKSRYCWIFLALLATPSTAQESNVHAPQPWFIPVVPYALPVDRPVSPPAVAVPPVASPAFRINYPAPLRSFLFGRFITLVQPPATIIRMPIND